MYYAQIKNGIATELENALYQWDANNYCTPGALVKDGKADQFGVVPLNFVDAPTYDPLTQTVIRDGCEYVNDRWQYKWRIDDLSAEQIAANQAAAYAAKLASFDQALTAHLDSVAQQRRYDNRITCMVRAGFQGPFQTEGIAFATWCDDCNAQAYLLLAEVQAGTRPLPDTPQALIDILPKMVWP